ncbi:MAG: tetratricopeptide repeat protein [Egibacteraceae bacterium]
MGLEIAKLALARGEGHRADGERAVAEAAYFEAAREAVRSASEEAQDATDVVMRARIGLGRVELMRGSPDRALGWFLNARQVAPDAWEPLYWQGCAQGWLGDHPGAERSFTAALELNPQEHSLAVQRAYARFKMGDRQAALDDLLAAERAGGLDDAVLLVLASLHFERDEWVEGERILTTLLDRDPENVKANVLMGIALERRARPEEAIGWYERAAERGDTSSRARLGVIHARAGRVEPALSSLRHARLVRRLDDDALCAYGWASFKAGLFQDGVDAWEELQRRRPDRRFGALLAAAKHELARDLISAGDYDSALPLLGACVDFGVGGQGAVHAIAEVRLRLAAWEVMERGQAAHRMAKERLATAGLVSLDDPRFPFFRGLLDWADGSPSTALPLLRCASDMGGLSRLARLAVVRCALEAGDPDGAARELLRLDDQQSHSQSQASGDVRRLAQCFAEGRWADAADLLLAGDVSDLREELLAHCLALAGRWTEVGVSTPEGARAGLVGPHISGGISDKHVIVEFRTSVGPDGLAGSTSGSGVMRLGPVCR